MTAKYDLDYENIRIEAVDKDSIDEYYKILKNKGWYDFTDDFILPEWNVDGVRIDTELNYPMTVRASQINCENTPSILGQIKSLRNI